MEKQQKTLSPGDIIKFTVFGMTIGILLILVMNRVFGIVTVSGNSMNPTYYNGDILRGEVVTKQTKIER
ncbi:MAG: hypothetical protein ACI4CS_00825, partial [Candidatus Weimeria sp.]